MNKLTNALSAYIRTESARRNLLDFGSLVYPGFQSPPHVKLLAGLLEDVERGHLRKLMVNISVRHGKSVMCSQVFPAWFLGRNPRLDVVLASHSQDLAVRNSRTAKSLIEDDRWPFPEVKLATDSTSSQRWNTTAGGGCFAIGVGSGITGRGALLGVIDDAINDARSQLERDNAWTWFQEVFVSRLDPGAAQVIVGARLASDDLCGRILESEDGPNWHVVNLPALAVEDDPLGRKPGEALWPERMDVEEINQRRVAMGTFAFSAQFQQDPILRKGGLIDGDWMAHTYDGTPNIKRKVMALDAAGKDAKANDYSAIVVLGTDDRQHYVLDVQRFKVLYPDLKRRLLAAYEEHQPSMILIEEASNGLPLISEMRSTMPHLPIKAVKPIGSKYARIEAITPILEQGKVLLPKGATFVADFVKECCAYGSSNSRNDDMLDAFAMALSHIRKRPSTVAFAFASIEGPAPRYSRY